MSIRINELSSYLENVIPSSLSCEWDNDGVMVCSDTEASVNRILLTLDVTMEALRFAKQQNCDTVISHHPLIFKPIRALTSGTPSTDAALYAVQNSINVLSYHTRLDALPVYGVNDTLSDLLEMNNGQAFGPEGEEIGRIGVLEKSHEFDTFCEFVKNKLGVSTLITVDSGREVHKLAMIGGDGKDYLIPAIKAGADTFLTGRCGYNLDIDAAYYGINVIEAGHYNTEAPVLKSLEKLISREYAEFEILFYHSDRTKAV